MIMAKSTQSCCCRKSASSRLLPLTRIITTTTTRTTKMTYATNVVTLLPLLLYMIAFVPTVVARGWVDMDTPLDKRKTVSLIDGTDYDIVMSDEFNVDGRSFKDGHDPIWTALDRSDDDASSAGGGSMQFYNSSSVSTVDGALQIRTYLEKTQWYRYDHVNKMWRHEIKNFTSGMVQSWNKFCFTGGIVEVDVMFPGDPTIGGLWPAVWMMGNLGRATYEASTNNLWPWSYDTCDRDLQQAQSISKCNRENHYGMNPNQGRGATEIDIVEVMMGSSKEALQAPNPKIWFPYADFTLQVAPGVSRNRPQPGGLPNRHAILSSNGHTQFQSQVWYDGLVMHGNTSINPYFYGTYLAETKPYEPVTRSKEQAFQADAIGVIHQLSAENFETMHTFRLEWQPGPGGRLDWFVRRKPTSESKTGRTDTKSDSTSPPIDDGEWLHAFGLKDSSLKNVLGSQIPAEPSYLIMNTAISSTWGFPYDTPAWCPRCYDCANPTCSCAFAPGFCSMLEKGDIAMSVDSVRVYQTKNHSAHVGEPHSLGCDPPKYPTKEWIEGHSYRYMRNPPFSFADRGPLRKVQKGGGECQTDNDCGANVVHPNLTAIMEQRLKQSANNESSASQKRRLKEHDQNNSNGATGRGRCVEKMQHGLFSSRKSIGFVCECNDGYTGPHCLAIDYDEKFPSAHELRTRLSPFHKIASFEAPFFMIGALIVLVMFLIVLVLQHVSLEKKARMLKNAELAQKSSRSFHTDVTNNSTELRTCI